MTTTTVVCKTCRRPVTLPAGAKGGVCPHCDAVVKAADEPREGRK